MTSGYVMLHRKINEWEWYTDLKTFKLFMHLIINANYRDGAFCGRMVKRGQLLDTLSGISEKTGLTVSEIRTSIKRMVRSGDISVEGFQRYTVITLVNYNQYQDSDTSESPENHKENSGNSEACANHVDKQMTSKSQTDDKQMTSKSQADDNLTYINNNINKNNKNNKNNNKYPFGRYKNVMLCEDEYYDLKERFSDFEERIERLSKYMADKKRDYASHYDTIIDWWKKEKPEVHDSNFNCEDYFATALARTKRKSTETSSADEPSDTVESA